MNTNNPLFKVFMSPKAHSKASEVLQSGYITQGPEVENFETTFVNSKRKEEKILVLQEL